MGPFQIIERGHFRISKSFEAALRRSDNNLFKRAYEQSLARTKDATHARLSVQRKILAVMRAVWMTGEPYRDELG